MADIFEILLINLIEKLADALDACLAPYITFPSNSFTSNLKSKPISDIIQFKCSSISANN
ncbi:hypothetical protein DERP_005647 [Dermatophagoides pteronyssinus]|uniref:Uncharacterized protein n=1 Tax=Dermatophagoides pteronyssinus TaxID=6956 RepID=A0ABQ8J996_DERPT|nr:hypothetical protein DERP_005647 [Dermatophagoides pteronyssinus]